MSDAQKDLETARAELQSLRAELEETNRGVLALYAELDTQAEQLRNATELKSRFLAYMSHEFRTPINSIRSITRLLLDRVDGELSVEQERQVTFIQQTSVEIAEMVDLFSALRGMFKPVITNPDVNLIFEEPAGAPKLFTDDRKVSQILRNFISNALKFTRKGEVRVSAEAVDSRVVFRVSDTGIGIAPEFHDSLFQDFTQVYSPLQKQFRGTGLGLALSKKLAEVLGGTVNLRSEPGKGSTFWLDIPSRLAEAPPAEGAG